MQNSTRVEAEKSPTAGGDLRLQKFALEPAYFAKHFTKLWRPFLFYYSFSLFFLCINKSNKICARSRWKLRPRQWRRSKRRRGLDPLWPGFLVITILPTEAWSSAHNYRGNSLAPPPSGQGRGSATPTRRFHWACVCVFVCVLTSLLHSHNYHCNNSKDDGDVTWRRSLGLHFKYTLYVCERVGVPLAVGVAGVGRQLPRLISCCSSARFNWPAAWRRL